MRSVTNVRWIIGACAVSLAASACQGGAAADEESGVFSASWTGLANPFEPANIIDTEGGKVLDMITRGLMRYDPETGEPKHMVAEKIESTDSQNFTITLKKGFTFSNGEKVTARSFVDAWNYAAVAKNKQANAPFFSTIEGYDRVHPDSGKATASTMSGIRVQDDQTFTVRLTQKFSTWPDILGYGAFSPLPRAFFDDHAAWLKKPIGNGPYEIHSYTKGSEMKLRRWEDYTGQDEAENNGIDLKVYNDDKKAYDDLRSGKLDLLNPFPPALLSRVKSDLGDRYTSEPAGVILSLNFPLYRKDWNAPGMEKVRRGLSMAIDRVEIAEKLFQKTLTPATDWTSPVLGEAGGYKNGLCGECTYDPVQAKKLIEEGGGLPGGKLAITYVSSETNKKINDAVCSSINKALGKDIACTGVPIDTFGEYLNRITSGQVTGPFGAGWQMDYPLIQDFLQPLYYTGASSNDIKFSSKAFDGLIDEANAETDKHQAVSKFQDAEKVLAEQMPSIPLWYANGDAGYSTRLSDVRLNPFSIPVYTEVDVR